MALVSMNTDDTTEDDSAGEYDPSPIIHLNDDQVEALGIKGMPAPGVVFSLQCRAVVTRVAAEGEESDEQKTEGSAPDVYLTLRVTHMSATRTETSAAATLYGED